MHMNNKQIKKLISRGEELIEQVRRISTIDQNKLSFDTVHGYLVWDYAGWKREVVSAFEESNADELVISGIESQDTIFVNPAQWAIDVVSGDRQPDAVRLYIDNVNKIINELRSVYFSGEKNIKINLDFNEVVPVYDKDRQVIIFGKHEVPLMVDSLESSFCNVLFNKMVKDEKLSWDIFWSEMNEFDVNEVDKRSKKQVQDVNRRVEKRVQARLNNREIKITKWERGNISRLF